ncbi:MAG: hypothetical protein EAZ27_07675 [Cytophagales bacterium]|nr:MAG: hypothetical protein EAZ27_07675 [Cytophagales bacterium]
MILSNLYQRNAKKIPIQFLKKFLDEQDFILNEIKTINSINELSNCKIISGYDGSYFRIKIIKDFRIGIQVTDNTVFFMCVAHRKDIYHTFPE